MEEVFSSSSTRVSLHSARVLSLLVRMVKGLLVEDRLDGVSNYGSWKPRVLLNLEENEVKDFSLTTVPIPDDATQLATWKRNDGKSRKILMDSMKNHLVSHLDKSETTKDMFESLKKLFERDSASRLISLRTQLHTIKMNKSVVDLRDQLGDIGEIVADR